MDSPAERGKVAFVLGGGGVLGAHEVGMLKALAAAGIRPDLIVGTSVGAINGVFAAAYPHGVEELAHLWQSGAVLSVFDGSLAHRVGTFLRSRTHMQTNQGLEGLLAELLPVERIEDLEIPFQCVAASIERATARWFCDGPIIPAVLASSAVPGLLPPVRIDGEHYLDGGLVHSIPVGRAVAMGADEVYVLHVGRIERPLAAPRRLWQVGMVAFEIARRHRFFEEMDALPKEVTVHVMPAGAVAGAERPALRGDMSPLRYRDTSRIDVHIQRAFLASRSYLESMP